MPFDHSLRSSMCSPKSLLEATEKILLKKMDTYQKSNRRYSLRDVNDLMQKYLAKIIRQALCDLSKSKIVALSNEIISLVFESQNEFHQNVCKTLQFFKIHMPFLPEEQIRGHVLESLGFKTKCGELDRMALIEDYVFSQVTLPQYNPRARVGRVRWSNNVTVRRNNSDIDMDIEVDIGAGESDKENGNNQNAPIKKSSFERCRYDENLNKTEDALRSDKTEISDETSKDTKAKNKTLKNKNQIQRKRKKVPAILKSVRKNYKQGNYNSNDLYHFPMYFDSEAVLVEEKETTSAQSSSMEEDFLRLPPPFVCVESHLGCNEHRSEEFPERCASHENSKSRLKSHSDPTIDNHKPNETTNHIENIEKLNSFVENDSSSENLEENFKIHDLSQEVIPEDRRILQEQTNNDVKQPLRGLSQTFRGQIHKQNFAAQEVMEVDFELEELKKKPFVFRKISEIIPPARERVLKTLFDEFPRISDEEASW